MRHSTCKVIILAGTAFCSGILSAARIVHSPVEALTQSGEIKFPYTDSRGGIWTASRCAEANEPSTDEVLTGTFTDWNDCLVGVVMSGVDMPRIGVNPGTTDYENGGLVFHPGDIFMHPYSPEQSGADGKSRGVLTFTVPRNGFYTIRAVFRTLDNNVSGISYTADTTILIDGAVQHQEDLVHDSFHDGAPFEREHVFLKKGSKIQFVIGPGWHDYAKTDRWFNHASDGTALKLDLIEEDSERFPDDAVLATASLNETLFQATTETVSSAEFGDISGLGTWSIYDSDYRNTLGYLDYVDKSLMNNVSATTMGTSGVRFESTRSGGSDPHLQVVGTSSSYGDVYPDDPWSNPAYGGGRYAPYAVYQPHEIELHPGPQGNVFSCVVMRFTVKETGVYAVTAKVRDTSCSGDKVTDGATGIYAWLHVNGVQSDGSYLGAEHADVQDAWTILRTEAVRLPAGSTVDLFIHPANTYYWDGTGVFFDIVRLKEATAEIGWDAGLALRENAQKGTAQTNPFVSQGATWTIGWQNDHVAGSSFVTAPDPLAVEPYLKGFADNSIEHFKICGNLATETVTGHEITSDGEMFYANEYFVHTTVNYNNDYPHAILRFTAPKTGVYSVDATFRDVSKMLIDDWWNTGVDCLIRAAGHYVASGVADIDANSRPEDLGPAILKADRLYLHEGESIDAMVGCRNAPWNDGTAVREFIRPDAAKEVVSVDFDVAGSQTYAGRGRVGFQSPKPWTKLLVTASASAERAYVRNDRGKTTSVKVTLTAPVEGALEPVSCGNADWPALITDGLRAANGETVYGWKVSGLEPGAAYTLYLYGLDQATFTVNGEETTYGIQQSCFFNVLSGLNGNNVRDHAVVSATANAAGEIVGTFAGTADGAGTFCGVQVEGELIEEVHRGLTVILR